MLDPLKEELLLKGLIKLNDCLKSNAALKQIKLINNSIQNDDKLIFDKRINY